MCIEIDGNGCLVLFVREGSDGSGMRWELSDGYRCMGRWGMKEDGDVKNE